MAPRQAHEFYVSSMPLQFAFIKTYSERQRSMHGTGCRLHRTAVPHNLSRKKYPHGRSSYGRIPRISPRCHGSQTLSCAPRYSISAAYPAVISGTPLPALSSGQTRYDKQTAETGAGPAAHQSGFDTVWIRSKVILSQYRRVSTCFPRFLRRPRQRLRNMRIKNKKE